MGRKPMGDRALTAAENMARYRERKKAAGLKRIELWQAPAEIETVIALQSELNEAGVYMNELQVFKYAENEVRTVQINDETWFVLKDVCDVLGLSNPTVVAERLDDDEVAKFNLGGLSGESNIVNESGLYNVIIRSDKTEAKSFKRWVTHEVLPSIRKNGGYIANQENLTPEQILANAMVVAQKIIAERESKIRELEPKAEFFDAVADSKDAKEMRDVAAALNIIGWGRNKIFAFLRDKKVLDKENLPYREFQDRGYFRVIEQKWADKEGETHISLKTLVYQKGIDHIRKLIQHSEEAA